MKEKRETKNSKKRKGKKTSKKRETTSQKKKDFKIETLYKSLEINKYFFLILALSLSVYCHYKNKSFTSSLLTFVLMTFLGYLAHVISHSFNANESFEKLENKTFFTSNEYTKPLIKKTCDFIDFHDKIHHDTKINKEPLNIFYEVVNNFLIQGGLVYLFYIVSRYIEPEMFILWAFMYTTIHHVNYAIIGSEEHKQHHANKYTNYGLDIWDIIFNTKPEEKEGVSEGTGGKEGEQTPENFNHIIFNLLVGLVILYFIF